MHPMEAVLGGQDEAFGQIIAGHHLALALGLFQKFSRPLRGRGVVHVENADDVPVPDSHIVANIQIHANPPCRGGSLPLPLPFDFHICNIEAILFPFSRIILYVIPDFFIPTLVSDDMIVK